MVVASRSTSTVIACTLSADEYKTRLAWLADLTATALRDHRRDDLRLELVYARQARERVQEMIRREQKCCAFLTFEVRETADAVQVTLMAPEAARDAVDDVFAPFLPK